MVSGAAMEILNKDQHVFMLKDSKKGCLLGSGGKTLATKLDNLGLTLMT